MKKIIFGILLIVLAINTNAQEKKKNKNATYDIEVSGNCDLCKKRIEKAAYATKGIKSAEYNIDQQSLHVIMNENKTSALQLQKNIAKVGHDTHDVKATEENYNKLHTCCKYDRKN